MNHKLIIFDVDGTLVDNMSSVTFNDDVVAKLVSLRHESVAIAIASNQGGVGLRYWMESSGFGEPDKYPARQDAMARLSTVAGNVTALTKKPCQIYAAFAYQTKAGKWAPPPDGSEKDPMWSQEWRKPNPGMLLQAMKDAGISPFDTLFVGDMDTDEQAAESAGVEFIHAERFFAPDSDDDQSDIYAEALHTMGTEPLEAGETTATEEAPLNWRGEPYTNAPGQGRPKELDDTARRHNLYCSDTVWEWLQRLGGKDENDRNAARGIRILYELHENRKV